MCLSNVYVNEKEEGKLVVEEAARITSDDQSVEVETLLGERKKMKGYYICAVDLINNYVILRENREDNSNA